MNAGFSTAHQVISFTLKVTRKIRAILLPIDIQILTEAEWRQMSAIALLQLPQSIEQKPVDLAEYISANEAAEKLGRTRTDSRGHAVSSLRRLAWRRWPNRRQRGKSNGTSNDLTIRDWRAMAARTISFAELEQCSGQQRNLALQKLACVKEYRKVINGASPIEPKKAALIERLRDQFPTLRISRNSLTIGTVKAYEGMAALVDKRGGRQGTEASAEAWKAFEDLYLHQNQPTVRHCWRIVKKLPPKMAGDGFPIRNAGGNSMAKSRRKNRHFIGRPNSIEPNSHRTFRQHEESWRAGQRWVSDHKQMDFWVCWRSQIIRPWLTVWMDWRTRKIVGWTLSDSPNSSTILGSFGVAMRDPANFGGPAEIVCDNGRDFVERHVPRIDQARAAIENIAAR